MKDEKVDLNKVFPRPEIFCGGKKIGDVASMVLHPAKVKMGKRVKVGVNALTVEPVKIEFVGLTVYPVNLLVAMGYTKAESVRRTKGVVADHFHVRVPAKPRPRETRIRRRHAR